MTKQFITLIQFLTVLLLCQDTKNSLLNNRRVNCIVLDQKHLYKSSDNHNSVRHSFYVSSMDDLFDQVN